MAKRPWTDAEFEVVRGPGPRRWDPLRGLSPLQRVIAVVAVGVMLWGLKVSITAPIAAAVDWLFALSGVGTGHP